MDSRSLHCCFTIDFRLADRIAKGKETVLSLTFKKCGTKAAFSLTWKKGSSLISLPENKPNDFHDNQIRMFRLQEPPEDVYLFHEGSVRTRQSCYTGNYSMAHLDCIRRTHSKALPVQFPEFRHWLP